MFKFLFKSKFLGFVEAPVGVFLFFFNLKKISCQTNLFPVTNSRLDAGLWQQKPNKPKFDTQVAELGQTQPQLVFLIFHFFIFFLACIFFVPKVLDINIVMNLMMNININNTHISLKMVRCIIILYCSKDI